MACKTQKYACSKTLSRTWLIKKKFQEFQLSLIFNLKFRKTIQKPSASPFSLKLKNKVSIEDLKNIFVIASSSYKKSKIFFNCRLNMSLLLPDRWRCSE